MKSLELKESIWITFKCFVLQLILGGIVGSLLITPNSILHIFLFYFASYFPFLFIILKSSKLSDTVELLKEKLSKSYYSYILIIIGYSMISIYFYNILKHDTIEIQNYSASNAVIVIETLFLILVAPLLEEILFRNIILNKLLRVYKPINAIFISSLLFSFIHFDIYLSINALFLGITLGFIYFVSRSLNLCILCHSIYNIMCLNYTYYVFEKININILELPLVGVLLLFLGGYESLKIIKKEKETVKKSL